MNRQAITNNPMFYKKYSGCLPINFETTDTYIDILKKARDAVHRGHRLLTHPLSGSIKPNQTPYKTILLNLLPGSIDELSLGIIEEGLRMAEQQQKNAQTRDLSSKLLEDFQLIDMDLMKHALEQVVSHGQGSLR